MTPGATDRYGEPIPAQNRTAANSLTDLESVVFDAVEPRLPPAVDSEPPAAPASPARQATILIVDDQQPNRELLMGYLTSIPCEVREAVDGEGALAAVAADPPDLILLDLLLPDVDGFALARYLHNGPHLKSVPLVVYSALELDDDDRARLGIDPDDCFSKANTRPEEVERRVLALLDHLITGAAR